MDYTPDDNFPQENLQTEEIKYYQNKKISHKQLEHFNNVRVKALEKNKKSQKMKK